MRICYNLERLRPWDEKKTYNKGDLVTARNLVFISQLDNNKGNEPGFSNAWNYYKTKILHSHLIVF